MIYIVRLAPRAWRDLPRLADFLAPRRATWPKARAAIEAALRSLEQFPERGALSTTSGMRELQVRVGTQHYVIQYIVEERLVAVLRIFHALEDR